MNKPSFAKHFGFAKVHLRHMRKMLGSTSRGLFAGLAAVALFFANVTSAIKQTAANFKEQPLVSKKNQEEVFEVRKSTVVALVVALAAVAGVLGALYFYVLRREKELDEYEQLLFSEDFNEDVIEPVDELLAEEE